MTQPPQEEARRARLGRRYGVIVLATIAVAFTGSSTWQIITQCFGLAVSDRAPSDECVRGIRVLQGALDTANGKAGRERDDAAVHRAWSDGLMPEWSQAKDTEQTCSRTQEGAQAYASLVRLRHAYEVALDRRGADVKPLRESLEAQLAPR